MPFDEDDDWTLLEYEPPWWFELNEHEKNELDRDHEDLPDA